MGLNMRYSGHKRVKKDQSIHLAPPQLLLKVFEYLTLPNTFFTKIQLLKIHTYFNINLAGILKYAALKNLQDIKYIHIITNILTSISTSTCVGS